MRKTEYTEPGNQYKTILWTTFGFSLVFVYVLSNGYYNMFVGIGRFPAALFGLLLALLAWGIGKFIGFSSNGISGHPPFFVLLLTLSAVGVFNSMMINLEGKQVFMEAVEAAKTDYKELTSSATKILYNELADRKKKKVEGIQELFFAELSNPQLCGQGPKARSLAAELADELPGFRTLAGGGDCKQVSALINSYTQSIHKLLANHPALTGHQESEELLRRIKESETIAQTKLDEIKKEIAAGDDLLGNIRPEIEDIAGTYQTLSTELAAKPSQLSFKANIDLNEVRGLGAWGQLPGLILSRVDRLSTYLYLLLAVFFDWMLVYFFAQLSEAKRAISNKPQGPRTDIKAHWQ